MGDASSGRHTGMLWETSSDWGVIIAHVALLAFVLFHLLIHQVLIKTFCIRHQLLPESSFHQLPGNVHNTYEVLVQNTSNDT